MKKSMNTTGRMTAMLLAFIMIISMAQSSVYASGSGPETFVFSGKVSDDEQEADTVEADTAQALTEQSVEASITAEPTLTGRLKAFGRNALRFFSFGNGMEPEIVLSGLLPEGAEVNAYPVSVEIPGQNVLAAYDISISVPELDENGEATGAMVEWQPDESLSVSIRDASLVNAADVEIYHMEDASAVPEVIDITTADNGMVSFDAESFSIYAIVETVLEKTISTPDGLDYKITVTYDSTSGLPEGVDLDVTEMNAADYQAATEAALESEYVSAVRAFDISILDRDGNKHQPTKDVNVTIELIGENDLNNPCVLHIPDGAEEADTTFMPAKRDGESGVALSFAASSFSVYVVTKDTPHVEYRFLDANGVEYVSLRQTLLLHEILVNPTAPTDEGKQFAMWVAVDTPEEAVSASSTAFNDWGEITSIEEPAAGGEYPIVKYLKSVYVEQNAQIHVTYFDQNGSVFRRDTFDAGTRIDPNGLEDAGNAISYSARQMEGGEYLTFRWWTQDLYILETDSSEIDSYGHPIKFVATDLSKDVELYPYCGPAHWLRFDGNKRTSDGDITRPTSVPYIGARLVLEGEVPDSVATPVTPTGYVFDGWYTKSIAINDGFTNGKVFNADGTKTMLATADANGHTTAFEHYLYTGGTSLDYDPTLYAHWTWVGTSTYSVAYYVQDPDDEVGLADSKKNYVFWTLHADADNNTRFNGMVNSEITLTTFPGGVYDAAALAAITGLDANGIVLNTTNTKAVRVSPDGSTVFNVYYDRKEFTLSFWQYVNETRSNASGRPIQWYQYGPSWLTGNNATEYVQKKLTALYGHDISSDHADGKGWPYNKNTKLQWIDMEVSKDSSTQNSQVTSNEVLVLTMPAKNKNYTDEFVDANYSYTRNFHMEKLSSTNDKNYSESYELDNETYKDVRTSSAGQGSMGIAASGAPLIPGFTLVRLVGGTNNATSANREWVLNRDYDTDMEDIGTGSMRYYGSGTNFQADLYYKRNTYPLTLRYKVNGAWVSDMTTDNAPEGVRASAAVSEGNSALTWSTVKFGAPLSGYLYDYATDPNHENLKNIRNDADAWWFYDEACTVPVDPDDLEKMTMPDQPLTLYEGLRTAYAVALDPNGGVLNGVNGSTWFSVDSGEAISEYTISRDYVLASEVGKSLEPGEGYFYKYSNTLNSLNYGVNPRTATYIEATEGETGEYVYYPGVWTFQYWYKVNATFNNTTETFTVNEQASDQNTAYDFSAAVTGPTYLKAKWVHEGTYTVIYDAGTARAPKDPNSYIEGSKALILPSVDAPDGKQFRFWSEEEQGSKTIDQADETKKHYPNSRMTVDHALAPVSQANQMDKTITLYAWYENGEFSQNHFADYRFYVPEAVAADSTDYDVVVGTGAEAAYYKLIWHDLLEEETGYNENVDMPYYIQTLSPGETLVFPQTPEDPIASRDGSFIGWFLDKECTLRFDAFGTVGTPVNTKLYASFARIYTATFYDEYDPEISGSGETINTLQTYREGNQLDVRKVQYATSNERYVAFWSTKKDDSLSHPTGTVVAYQGKGGVFGVDYTRDMFFYPILGDAHTLNFDSCGGSYVAPIDMPRKAGRWRAAPDDPVRQGYIFQGWWTERQADSEHWDQGGVQYNFDMTLEDFQSANSLTEIPDVLYAHWQVNDLDKPKTTITVNYWIQDPEKSSYILWTSEQISNLVVDSSFTLPTSGDDNYATVDKIKGYYTFTNEAKNDPDNENDDRPYFLAPSVEAGTIKFRNADGTATVGATTTVQMDGKTVYDLYFDRKTYTLNINPYWTGQENNQLINFSYNRAVGNLDSWSEYETTVSYTYRGKIDGVAYTASNPYSITVWLGKNVAEEWPVQIDLSDNSFSYNYTSRNNPYFNAYRNGTFISGSEVQEDSTLRSHYAFSSWVGTGLPETYNTPARQVFVGKNLIPTNDVATFNMSMVVSQQNTTEYVIDRFLQSNLTVYAHEPKALDDEATVHYLIPMSYNSDGTVNEWTELTSYQQTLYGVTGNNQTGANWKPNTTGLNLVMSEKLTINGYEYDESGDAWTSEEKTGTKEVTLYKYRMPDANPVNNEYASANAVYGNYNYYHKWGNVGNLAYLTISIRERDEWVERGAFSFIYYDPVNIFNPVKIHRDSDPTYLADNSISQIGVNAWNSQGISTNDLKNVIIESFYETKTEMRTLSGKHIYLHYIPQNYELLLRSTEDKDWRPEKPAEYFLVPYGSYLTSEDGSNGYINNTLQVYPPNVTGKVFAGWSKNADTFSPFEGTMPDYLLRLFAHYEDQQVTVTIRGVKADGTVNRESTADDNGWLKPKTDANGVLEAWGDDTSRPYTDVNGNTQYEQFDVSNTKVYNTRLMEYEFPKPVLEPNEIFFGWKRVLFDDSGNATGLAAGYVSNSTHITADTVLVPDIRFNRSGYVVYDGNGNTAGTVPPQEGGFYLGGSIKAKEGDGLSKEVTVGGSTYTRSFVCWNTEADGSGTDYYPGDSVALPAHGTITLYAKYAQVRTIRLVYHLSSDTGTAAEFLPATTGDTVHTGTLGEDENEDTVVTINFPDYVKPSAATQFPNTEYPANRDSSDVEFYLSIAGKTFLGWSESSSATTPTVLSTDSIRVNTRYADENNDIHLYPVWENVMLPVTVYEVTLGDYANAVQKMTAEGQNGFLTLSDGFTVDTGYASATVAETKYNAVVRNNVPATDTFGKAVLSSDDTTEIVQIRLYAAENRWEYTADGDTWIPFGDDGLKLYYFPDPVTVPVYYYMKNLDGTLTRLTASNSDVPTADNATQTTIASTVVREFNKDGQTSPAELFAAQNEITLTADSKKVKLSASLAGPYDAVQDNTPVNSASFIANEHPLYFMNTVDGVEWGTAFESAGGNISITDGTLISENSGRFAVYLVYSGTEPLTITKVWDGNTSAESIGVQILDDSDAPLELPEQSDTNASFDADTKVLTLSKSDTAWPESTSWTVTVPSDAVKVVETQVPGYITTYSTDDGSFTETDDGKTVTITNTRAIVKITDNDGRLLYKADGTPAVYTAATALEDAFEAINDNGDNSTATLYKSYTDASDNEPMDAAGPYKVQMLVSAYTMTGGAILESGKTVTLTTASASDTDGFSGPYDGTADTRAVITRDSSFTNASMIGSEGTLTIASVILDGGNVVTSVNGGIVNVSAGKLHVNNDVTMRNSKAQNGGAIYANVSTTAAEGSYHVELDALDILDCYASANGGAICLEGKTSAKESDLDITGHTDHALSSPNAVNGGAIYVGADAAMLFTGGEIEYCSAEYGGGVYSLGTLTMEEDATLESTNLRRGAFEYCAASADGGGMYIAGGSMSMTGGAIEHCTAAGNGGGIYKAGTGTVTMSSDADHPGLINDCSAVDGGAIYVAEGELDMTGGTIKKCHATGNGGGVYNKATLKVEHTGTYEAGLIEDCRAGGNGGAIYEDNDDSMLVLTDITIQGHTAGDSGLPADTPNAVNGGGIYVNKGGLTLTGSRIYDCTTESNGGAIYDNSLETMTISGTTFNGHTTLAAGTTNAVNGGGIYIPDHGSTYADARYLNITGSSFYNMTASANGGAIYNQSSAKGDGEQYTVEISNSNFNGHYDGFATQTDGGQQTFSAQNAVNGGAIYMDHGYLKVTGGTIENCSASERGGAIYNLPNPYTPDHIDEDNASVKLTGVTITESRSGLQGGGVYMKVGRLVLEECSLTGLQSGAGAALYAATNDDSNAGAEIIVRSSTISDNTATSGPDADNPTAEVGGAINVKNASSGGVQPYIMFEGTTVVRGNGNSSHDNDHQHNMVLEINSSETIFTTASGLSNGTNIGVYVTGQKEMGNQTDPYHTHGNPGQPFGTHGDGSENSGTALLSLAEQQPAATKLFVNDRDSTMYGILGTTGSDTEANIVWHRDEDTLTVTKVWSVAPDNTIDRIVIRVLDSGNYELALNGQLQTDSNVTIDTNNHRAILTKQNGTWPDVWTVVVPSTAASVKEEQVTGYVETGNVFTSDENEDYFVTLTNSRPVCKITYVDTSDNERKFYAAYASLAEALAAAGDSVFISEDKTDVRIEMLVSEYSLPDTMTVADGIDVTLTTAAPGVLDDSYSSDNPDTYPGINSTAVIKRGSVADNASMFNNHGKLTLANITVDGEQSSHTTVKANGGIVNNEDSVSLTVGEGATLQNSATSGSGGAIYGGSVIIAGGSITGNTASDGAVSGMSILNVSGNPTIYDNKVGDAQHNVVIGSSTIININGPLGKDAQIGVYAASSTEPYIVQGGQFGTYGNDGAAEPAYYNNNLNAFWNDVNKAGDGTTLRGADGGNGRLIWQLGTVTVIKKVAGDMGDPTKEFTFTISVDDVTAADLKAMNLNLTALTQTGSGPATFALKGGSTGNTITINVPDGKLITLVETNAATYETTIGTGSDKPEGMTGDVDDPTEGAASAEKTMTFTVESVNKAALLTVVNTLGEVAPTGLNLTYAPFALMLLFGAILLLITALKRRARN